MLYWCVGLETHRTMFPKYLQDDVLDSMIIISELEILLILNKPPPSRPIKKKVDENLREKYQVKKIKNIVYQTFPIERRIEIQKKYDELSTPILITKRLMDEIEIALDKIKMYIKRNSVSLGNFRTLVSFDDLEFVLISIVGNKRGSEYYNKFLNEINRVIFFPKFFLISFVRK